MNLTEAQLQEIEDMARAFLSPEEICIVVGITDSERLSFFTKENPGAIYDAYMRGKLKRKFQLNNLMLDHAIAGSQPAQDACNKLNEEQIANE